VSVWEQVGAVEAAKTAVGDGVEVIVAQGWEAGGHNYGGLPAMVLVPEILDACRPHWCSPRAASSTDGALPEHSLSAQMVCGDWEEMPWLAGQGVSLIHDIRPAKDIVETMRAEAQDILRRFSASLR